MVNGFRTRLSASHLWRRAERSRGLYRFCCERASSPSGYLLLAYWLCALLLSLEAATFAGLDNTGWIT
jgi:uncharacterized membrane protein